MKRLLLLVGGWCILGLAACSSTPAVDVAPLKNTGAAEQHMVQSKALKDIMRSLDYVVYNQKLNALQVDEDRRRRALQMSKQIEDMSGSILALVGDDGPLVLGAGERKQFVALVMQLRTHGEEIHWLAESYRNDELGPALDRMVDTCNSCHDRFRSM